jgi:Chitobiase/beta-hexosaminidase C-terminal domain
LSIRVSLPLASGRNAVLCLFSLVIALATLTGCGGMKSASALNSTSTSSATPTAPSFSPGPGTYSSAQSISISDAASPGSSIFYTLDGSNPSAASPKYAGPILVSATATLKALALADGQTSPTTSGSYTIVPASSAPPPPSFSPAPGSYSSIQSVSISDTAPGTTIYYTLDGSTPSAASTQYTTPINLSSTTTLRALAVAGGQSSTASSGTYTISLPPSKIVFASQPGDSTVGAAVAPAVMVALEDSNGNRVASASGEVTLSLQQNGSSAVLAGTTSGAASAGLASFSNLIVNAPGSGYTLVASASGLPNAQSAPFTVVPQLPSQQAAEADSFVDSIGVQTHASYINTPYANWSQVIAALQSLGVRHVRDGLPVTSTFVSNFQQLAAAGIGCTCGFELPNSLTTAQIASFVQQAQNVEALEAPNECDAGTNCGGGGLIGIANVVAFLPILQSAAHTVNVPAIGPSFQTQLGYVSAGNVASLIADNNLHIYFDGRNPGSSGWGEGDPEGNFYGSFSWWIDQGNLDAPNTPDMVTETGYMAFPTATQTGTIPESVEASYIPRTLLLSYLKGIKRTFVYELLDEFTTTGYGLLANDFSEKPAFVALKSLISTLQDPGAQFTPASLNYSITGNTNTMQQLLLQKRDGSYWLVLWLEQSSYDVINNVSTPVTPQTVNLSIGVGSQLTNAIQFDNTGHATTMPLTGNGYSTSLILSDQVSIVEIEPK